MLVNFLHAVMKLQFELLHQFFRFSISFSPSSGSGLEKWGALKSRSDRPDSTGGLENSCPFGPP